MKIEKVNDNQIRCTLTRADLEDRHLQINELAYGTEKAKSLFRDLMQQAAYEFGFEAEDIPLMIEAIPLSPDCIVLIVTKVEDPEELDTRFAKFAPFTKDDADEMLNSSSGIEGADDILGLFKKIRDEKIKSEKKKESGEVAVAATTDLSKLYVFKNLDTLISAAHILNNYYKGSNSLYKNAESGSYSLVIRKTDHSPEEFNKICNMISEYGSSAKSSIASEAYMDEHFDVILRNSALQKLASV